MDNLLFTGASGFLGSNVKPILKDNYNIFTIGLGDIDDIKFNIANGIPQLVKKYDIVLHAAGKAHVVPKNIDEENEFYKVNFDGTINLCKALERAGLPKSFIFVSTVAVYGCEFGENINENYLLNGNTPYALSKIKAEEYLIDWCKKNNVILSIIRPSLIAGPNSPGNLGDMIKGIKKGFYLNIGGGKAKKSVLMVQDIANLIPFLSTKGGIYNVCDDYNPSFGELSKLISSQMGKSKPFNIPYFIAKILALIGDILGNKAPINSFRLKKITESLTFSNEKAKRELGWKPLNVLENFKIE